MTTKQSEAEKAAEEYKAKIIAEDDIEARRLGCSTSRYFPADMLRTSFLAGAAWAAPKWVRCSERLPEKGKDVLVYVQSGNGDCWHYVNDFYYGDNWQMHGYGDRATHWCELPAAPEVEK